MRNTYTGNEGMRDSSQELIYGINIRNTVLQQLIAVGTSATPLPTTQLSKRMSLLITNDGTAVVYIGSSTVTKDGATKGFPIYPRGSLLLNCEDKVDVYGIVATGTVNVIILEGA